MFTPPRRRCHEASNRFCLDLIGNHRTLGLFALAKRRSKSNPSPVPPATGLRQLATREFWTRPAVLSGSVKLVILGAVIAGLHWGLGRLEAHVHRLPQYRKVLALQWEDLPDLFQRPYNRHIIESLTRKADLRSADHLLDGELARRIATNLSDTGIGWIKSVDRVTVRPDGLVSIRCRFREPVAFVQHGDWCYLVDAESVLLPGKFRPDDCTATNLLTITGLRAGPPAVGQLWPGADLQSGLKLAALIDQRRFKEQVQYIVVSNHEGREDKTRPHIELATNHRGSRVWWGRPPFEEHGLETTAHQKLALLEWLYNEYGRIDLNRAYVDLRTHPNSVSMSRELERTGGTQ